MRDRPPTAQQPELTVRTIPAHPLASADADDGLGWRGISVKPHSVSFLGLSFAWRLSASKGPGPSNLLRNYSRAGGTPRSSFIL